jgi:hypothetical protein
VADEFKNRLLVHARMAVDRAGRAQSEAAIYRNNLQDKVYVSGDVHTNTIDGFWTHLKRGVSGLYRGVSPKHLQSYLDEYVFRYNRGDERGTFTAFLERIEKASPDPSVPS